jgi:hypothetical protein
MLECGKRKAQALNECGLACAGASWPQKVGWNVKLLSYTEGATGGYKEVICQVRHVEHGAFAGLLTIRALSPVAWSPHAQPVLPHAQTVAVLEQGSSGPLKLLVSFQIRPNLVLQ